MPPINNKYILRSNIYGNHVTWHRHLAGRGPAAERWSAKPKPHLEQGFTLLEMLLAIALLSVVMLIAGTSIYTVQRGWSRISANSIELKRLQMVDRIADSAFRNAVPFTWKDINNQTVYCFRGEPDNLLLTYLHRIGANDDHGGVRFIRLYLQDDKLIAEYRKTPLLPDEPGDHEHTSSEVISENVKRIEFTYIDADAITGELEYDNIWDMEEKRNIPLAIQLKIEWNDASTEVWLRRTAGNSASSSYGKRQDQPPVP
jgi:prepilin-type N-terminal cleavage/methylation domain-containing protein